MRHYLRICIGICQKAYIQSYINTNMYIHMLLCIFLCIKLVLQFITTFIIIYAIKCIFHTAPLSNLPCIPVKSDLLLDKIIYCCHPTEYQCNSDFKFTKMTNAATLQLLQTIKHFESYSATESVLKQTCMKIWHVICELVLPLFCCGEFGYKFFMTQFFCLSAPFILGKKSS